MFLVNGMNIPHMSMLKDWNLDLLLVHYSLLCLYIFFPVKIYSIDCLIFNKY